ncbi:glycoside hydrolase N-terminal domain-containing protein [Dysgonomonas sp. 25]|uniref:glycoside hydrolase family 95 protein n=1 Tax=Dysgonomonas sp. 25 TaxID=2302933 RepID=UPI0013D54B1F|nr:glycoside hydrolase family 95 protein [Dysgonomonas sp. 25]NDV67962.1 glycoside hydrolase family 95 protein [Dysgonomonas sp. 25]
MRKYILYLILFSAPLLSQAQEYRWGYHFDRPAEIWEESIPLGNGRIGMMPWGGVDKERIILNEISLWAGSKQDADNPDANKHLSEIRRLLFENKNKEAQELMYKTFTCLGGGGTDITRFGNYQNLGNLYIQSLYSDSLAPVSRYKRWLDMDKALSGTSYQKGGITYHREYFTSFTEDVGIIRYTADKKEAISLLLSLQRDENYQIAIEDNCLTITGQMPSASPDGGVIYYGKIRVENQGGELALKGNKVEVRNADEVVIYVSLATDFGKSVPAQVIASDVLRKADKDYLHARKQHSEAYQQLFGRVDVTLGRNDNSSFPIDKRLEAFVSDKTDADLAALYMQYGRYLLISSTRKGGLPPNLQGLWAPQIYTPWNGDYHLNINLQMNYWPAETGNLPELHTTLSDYVKTLVEPGEKTAQIYYGSRGWVTHILGNVWQFTSPSEDPSWGATNTAGAWLCQHLWQHYEFTLDREYLRSVYPVMKGASLFFYDMLVENPNNGYLVTAPTTSPENKYITAHNDTLSICAGSTMDNQLVRELFTNTIQAASVLGIDKNFREELEDKKAHLAPTSIGKYGQIMEWIEDYDEAEPHHRHVSQLYGLHPGNELTYEQTPELMEAAKVTLRRRGDESTGWSMAWKINFWARLKDGNHAYKLIGDLFKPARNNWGTYPNLFSAHPPMQIDGNFGGSAGIMEMLLQSHAGYIELLPAIPDEWAEGEVKGLKVRGNGEISFSWKNKTAKQITLKALSTNRFALKLASANVSVKGVKDYKIKDNILYMNMYRNEIATITVK